MREKKIIDFITNVALPLLAGLWIYWSGAMGGYLRNHLPDGLWAYSFLSCLLLIWNREINKVWVITACLASVVYEWMQHEQRLDGTGDVWDVVNYLVFFMLALYSNRFWLRYYQSANIKYQNNKK
jgi:hypothetical protein